MLGPGPVVLGTVCRRFKLAVPAGFEAEPFLRVTLLPKDNRLLLEVRKRAVRGARCTGSSRQDRVQRCPLGHGVA